MSQDQPDLSLELEALSRACARLSYLCSLDDSDLSEEENLAHIDLLGLMSAINNLQFVLGLAAGVLDHPDAFETRHLAVQFVESRLCHEIEERLVGLDELPLTSAAEKTAPICLPAKLWATKLLEIPELSGAASFFGRVERAKKEAYEK